MTIDPVSIGITLALTAAQMGLQATRKIEGPRLEDLKVSVADYGTPLNYFYGIRRFEGCPIFFAEPIKEVKKKRKTKGGKYNDYTYYGTWAVAVADHEIEAITRIWFDKHLVYDTTGAGPITPFAFAKGFNLSDYLRIYLGTEDQEPDARMLATVEAEHGAGSCPAYRGVSYVMFEEIPLEKFANRIPQIAIEAVSRKAPRYPWETHDSPIQQPYRMWGFTYSPDFSRMIYGADDAFAIWDVPTRALMSFGAFPSNVNNIQETFGLSNAGVIYAMSGSRNDVLAFSADGFGAAGTVFNCAVEQSDLRVLADGGGSEYVLTIPWSTNQTFYVHSLKTAVTTGYVPATVTGSNWKPVTYVTDGYGDIWAVGALWAAFHNPTTLYFLRVVNYSGRPGVTDFHSVTVASASPGPSVGAAHNLEEAQFVVHWNEAVIYLIDDETFAIKDSASFVGDVYNTSKQWANLTPGAKTIWLNNSEVSLADLSVIRTVVLNDWKAEDADGIIYDPVNHALICAPQFDQVVTWRFLDRITNDGITLASIVEDVAARCGIEASDVDASALDQTVTGYSWVQGSGKDILEPIMDAYDSILRPHDFALQGLKLGSASGGTIEVAQFVRAGNDPRYKIPTAQDTDLPRTITLSFADIAADQQPNAVVVQRPLDSVDGVRELSIDMTPLALDVDEAKQLAERVFRRRWFEAQKYDLSLTAQYLALEPGDVRTFNFDGIMRIARIDTATLAPDGAFTLALKRDDPAIATLSGSSGAPMDGRVPSIILIGGPTKGFVIDAPLMRDSDDQSTPFAYLGAGPYGDVFWPGADFYQSETGDPDTYDAGWAAISSDAAMDWGFASNALGDAEPWVIDNGAGVNVKMQVGTLTSMTLDDLLLNQQRNLLLISTGFGATGPWEYVQFQTATLESDGSYTLSGLIRGQRGTEAAVGLHAAGDVVIVADTANLKRTMGAGEIADTDYYRAVTQGRDDSSAFVQSLTFGASAQRPYAPVYGTLEKDSGSGDWSIDAIRRTRIGGANVNGQDVPLGETAESWSADILDGADVVRTITGSSLPLTYTDAMAVADFGSNPSSLDVNLYQVSPALSLRGYPLALAA